MNPATLSPTQFELIKHLRSGTADTANRQAVYRTEWLGHLPFGLYHWIEVDGHDITSALRLDWSQADLDALEQAGLLSRVDAWSNPNDEFETRITYQVSPADAETDPELI